MHVQKPTMEADQLQIISREIGSTGTSFTGLTLATQELLTLLFQGLIIFVFLFNSS